MCYNFTISFLHQAKIAAFIWGLVASVRRVMGIVIFFTPALGLLDLLWHWHAERFPFQVTLLYIRAFRILRILNFQSELVTLSVLKEPPGNRRRFSCLLLLRKHL